VREGSVIACRDQVITGALLGSGLDPELLSLWGNCVGRGVSSGLGRSPAVNSGL